MKTTLMHECINKHNKKYNCAQAIACVYAPLLGVSEKEAFHSIEAFGFGMGCNLSCGVLSGLAYLVGLKYSDSNLDDPQTKHICYEKMQEISQKFTAFTKDTSCYHLKGIDRNQMLDCSWIIAYGAYLAERYIFTGLFMESDEYLKYEYNGD